MVLAEEFTMSRTDEVNRLTENVYKVRAQLRRKVSQIHMTGGFAAVTHTHTHFNPTAIHRL